MKLFVKYENCDNGKQISKRSSIGPSYRKLLYDVLLRVEFKNVLEIGCYRGYSSVAFLQALDDGAGFRYTIADPRPDMLTLTTLVERCDHRDKVKIRRKKSIDVIDKHFDFIFVDGNHTAEGIGPELLRILECQTKTLMALC
jgi:predicted O-methyltransferase YrrM